MKNIIKNTVKIAIVAAFFIPFANVHAASPIACPLSAGAGDVVVKFPPTLLLSNNGNSEARVSANIPAGKYNVTAVTWDDHTGHTGQGQQNEKVFFSALNSAGSVLKNIGTSADIPENSDSRTTSFGQIQLSSAASTLKAVHAAKGTSNNYESVYPICVKFDKIEDPVDPPEPPVSNNLNVSCSVSDTTVEEDELVIFSATATGGSGYYYYDWSGDVSGINRTTSERFDDEGRYYATVRVADTNGRVASANCATVRVEEEEEDDLEVQCRVSDSRIEEGDRITIEVEIDGGEGPFDIEWDGDIDDIDDFDDNDRSQRVRFDDAGTYDLEVEVEDDNGDRDRDTCRIRVSDEDDNDVTVVSNNNPNDGNLASLSSIYLNQVPYTGPEEVATVAGFIALLIVWSATIAYVVLRKRNKSIVSNKIAAFKEANRLKRNA